MHITRRQHEVALITYRKPKEMIIVPAKNRLKLAKYATQTHHYCQGQLLRTFLFPVNNRRQMWPLQLLVAN